MDQDCKKIIDMLGRDELKLAIDALGVTGVDRRSPAQMQLALSQCRTASVEGLLRVVAPTRQRQLRTILRSTQEPPVRSAAGSPCRPKGRRDVESAGHLHGSFVAIDFETADSGRDSACAIAAVRVEGDRVVDKCVRLIRPPRQTFQFTYIHGIRWADVAREPTFGGVWTEVKSMLKGVSFLVAHNAAFDKGVLNACCARAGIDAPSLPFECTVRWARQVWGLYPTNLPAVCRHLDLPLVHHDPASDAEACARIMIAARRERVGARERRS